MRSRVWLLAHSGRLGKLEVALRERGADVQRVSHDMADLALSVYDASGLLLVDATSHEGVDALRAGVALLPVLAIAAETVELPPGVMRVSPLDEGDALAHQVGEVLSAGRNLRQHPRARVNLRARIGRFSSTARDVSFYGLWLDPAGPWTEGQALPVTLVLSDGARLSLDGTVVGLRDAGAAVRCRPSSDMDLVLWVHLLLGALEDSPLHRDADPFGPLFE